MDKNLLGKGRRVDKSWQICHTILMLDALRDVLWFKAALKDFKTFPLETQRKILGELTLAQQGEKGTISKPMKGLGAGVFEIFLKYRKNAYRAVYALQVGKDIWVVHCFKKKSKTGIKTPKQDIDLIKARINFLKERGK